MNDINNLNFRDDGSVSNDGINDDTYYLLFSDKDNCDWNKYTRIIETLEAFTIIYKFGIDKKYNRLSRYYYYENTGIDLLELNLDCISFDVYDNVYVYDNNGNKFKFYLMSDIFSEEKDILSSFDRYHYCHNKSCDYVRNLLFSKIITGYMHKGNIKYIHSVFESDNLIFDYTRNLCMEKEDYYKIFDFEVLSEISHFKFNYDLKHLYKTMNYLGLKTYLIFRDELAKDYKKKTKMFK